MIYFLKDFFKKNIEKGYTVSWHILLFYWQMIVSLYYFGSGDWRNISTTSAVGLSGYKPTSKKNWKVLHHCLKLLETLVEVIERLKSDINKDNPVESTLS